MRFRSCEDNCWYAGWGAGFVGLTLVAAILLSAGVNSIPGGSSLA